MSPETRRVTCAKCGLESGDTITRFGECPQCQRIWCSNCYSPGMGKKFGIMMWANLCPDCRDVVPTPLAV
jgi:hypothetical protein